MKLLRKLRKKYSISRAELQEYFGFKSHQAYENMETKAKYFTIVQVLKMHDLFCENYDGYSEDFIAELRKEDLK